MQTSSGIIKFIVASGMVLGCVAANAQVKLAVPATSETTTVHAVVTEQARVTLPSTLNFAVPDTSVVTQSAPNMSLSIDNIALAPGKKLKLSLQADTASFSVPGGTGTTYLAGDISWDGSGTLDSGAMAAGTLSNSAYAELFTSAANPNTITASAMKFYLAARPTVNIAGDHTIVMRWKVESVN